MKNRHVLTRITLLAAGALTVAACGSASAARWNGRGNDAFAKQSYSDAQIAYEKALAAQPARPQALYNLGNTQFRQQADTAQTTLAEAAQAAQQDDQLAAEAFYNLGNTRFAAADYAGAIDAYKETLRRTPDDMDAKVNLELALRKQQENEPTPTSSPEASPEASPTAEATEEPSPTPTPQPQDGSPTAEATPTPQETPSPEATATPEPNATSTETATPAGTGTPEGTPTAEASPSPNPEGTPTEMPGGPTPDPSTLPPGQMTDAQARQLLDAATSDTQTLQERLQQTLHPLDPTQDKDW